MRQSHELEISCTIVNTEPQLLIYFRTDMYKAIKIFIFLNDYL